MIDDSIEVDTQKRVKPIKNSDEFVVSNKDKYAFEGNLLRLVFSRPPLYNNGLPIEERTLSICNELWKEVTDELAQKYGSIKLEYIKKIYKYHRTRYNQYRKAVCKIECGSKINKPKHIEILRELDSINALKVSFTHVPVTTSESINVCRTCLIEKSDMKSIFSMQLINTKLVKISEMISMCTGLEFSEYDNLSNLMCDACINNVSLAFEFRNKCWDSHKLTLEKLRKSRSVIENNPPLSPVNRKELMQVKRRTRGKDVSESDITTLLKDYVDITLDATVYRGKRFKCRYCEQNYSASHLIIDHLENKHKFNIKPATWLKCSECPKTFPSQIRLSVHMKEHGNRTLICQQCGASVHKDRFAEHYRSHTGEKPFKCDSCDFRSAYMSSLKKHNLTHTGEKPAVCHICGQAYRTSSQRAVHVRSHSEETPFKCVICKRAFKRPDMLKGHMQTHQPSKMYECKICNRKFSQRGSHRMHMMQHTGRRPQKCSECGKGFIQRHCWRTHLKNHHKIVVQ